MKSNGPRIAHTLGTGSIDIEKDPKGLFKSSPRLLSVQKASRGNNKDGGDADPLEDGMSVDKVKDNAVSVRLPSAGGGRGLMSTGPVGIGYGPTNSNGLRNGNGLGKGTDPAANGLGNGMTSETATDGRI